MKLSPTWQQIVLIAILLAAIPLTYAFVAPAAGVVTGMVSTLVGAFFVNLRDQAKQEAASAPVLQLVPKPEASKPEGDA
jgi:hypothetical protein